MKKRRHSTLRDGKRRYALPPRRYWHIWDREREERWKRGYPRADEPWKLSEDRRLLRLYEQHRPTLRGWPLWNKIAAPLRRTAAGCATRYYVLRTSIERCGKLRPKEC